MAKFSVAQVFNLSSMEIEYEEKMEYEEEILIMILTFSFRGNFAGVNFPRHSMFTISSFSMKNITEDFISYDSCFIAWCSKIFSA